MKKERKKPPPKDNIKLAEAIHRKALLEIYNRQHDGGRLSGEDHKFIKRIKDEAQQEKIISSRTLSGVRQDAQSNIEKSLQATRYEAFAKLRQLMRESKREDVALRACELLVAWADREEPPQEPYELEDAEPQKEKVVSINQAVA